MRRAAPTLPVTPTMLRHFVVVTLVATLGLAMFASGENASTLAEARKAKLARSSGAWGTAPAKPVAANGPRTVNGMQVASGTKLENNGGYNDEPEVYRTEQEVQGDIRNLNPEYRSLPVGAVAADPLSGPGPVQAPAAAAAIQRDRNGVPLPPGSTGPGKSPANAKPQPPRRANTQDIERMMEASSQRSAAGKSAAAGGRSTEDE